MNKKQVTKKLKFEKPEVHTLEFLACSVPTVSAGYPILGGVAATCNIAALALFAPAAVAT